MNKEITSPHHNPVPHGLADSCSVSSRANDGAAFFTMSKHKLYILGRIFAREIEGYPLQNRRPSQSYFELVNAGMIEEVEYNVGPVNCKGWALTHLGRMTYCQSCTEDAK